jgi:hypothetical protein
MCGTVRVIKGGLYYWGRVERFAWGLRRAEWLEEDMLLN